jgi:putative Holliday junction resolvase
VSSLKRILGIDYGSKRIGIAVSDPLGIIAQGVSVVANSSTMINEIKKLVHEYSAEMIVVGMPLNLKGEKGIKAEEVEKFITQIEKELQIEVVRFDERFTSKMAHQTLRDMEVKKKKRQAKGTIDRMAAALILQGYLDSH